MANTEYDEDEGAPCVKCANRYRDYANRTRCHVHCDFIENLPIDEFCKDFKEQLPEDIKKLLAEKELKLARKNLAAAEKRVQKASEARKRLEPGTSRARVTTANARLTVACEARDRYEEEVRRLEYDARTGA